MAPNEDELKESKESLKIIGKEISEFKNVVDDLINSFNGTLRLFQNYYDIAKDIIYKYEHFNKNKDKEKELLNFTILKSLHNLKLSNQRFKEDIDSLINQNNRTNKAITIIYIYEYQKYLYRGDENNNSKKDNENDNDYEWLNMIKEKEKKIEKEKEKKEKEKKEEERKKEEEGKKKKKEKIKNKK